MSLKELHRAEVTYGTVVVKIWRCIQAGSQVKAIHQHERLSRAEDERDAMTFKILGRSRNALQALGMIEKPGILKAGYEIISMIDSEDKVEVVPRRIKVKEQGARFQATQTPAATQLSTHLSGNDRGKKRKLLEDELEQVEDEERLLELKLRKRRLQRDLARLEEEDAEWTLPLKQYHIACD
jgi:hypothetical protein